MATRFTHFVIAVCLTAALCPRPALSYKLSPRGTKVDVAVARQYSSWFDKIVTNLARTGADHFTEPVHEEITNRIYNCNDDDPLCNDPDSDYAGPYILAGVRWNDDPPFQLQKGEAKNLPCRTDQTIRFTTQPRCWVALFQDAGQKAAKGIPLNAGTHASLLARSHYGDLQFLHAMASADGEPAKDTHDKIMMWAEFTWKVSNGDYPPDAALNTITILGFEGFFGDSGKQVQDLFALGNPALKNWVAEVALGSLLHVIEDSFAGGHVDRANEGGVCPASGSLRTPGPVREFYSYINQDPDKHSEKDKRSAFLESLKGNNPTVVDVGRTVVEYHNKHAPWDQIRPYLDCVFQVVDPQAKASPGAAFQRD
ncbi:MAG TPA: hypothetical protein VHY84_26915 [Bryobacteraceae bacterium]|jgi:hypothetical protein|nr:hypothetical protein [Bryobacteraceae bacterium]